MCVLSLHGDGWVPGQRPSSVYVHIHDHADLGSRTRIRFTTPGITRHLFSSKASYCNEVILTRALLFAHDGRFGNEQIF